MHQLSASGNTMPRCDGLPFGPCPGNRNDNTVKLGEGDLMLCKSCDGERHRMWLESLKQKKDGDDGTASATVSAQPSAEVMQPQPQPPERRAQAKTQGKHPQKEVTVFNELLMYAVCERDKANVASLRSVISSFYSSSEISSVKKQIVTNFGPHLSNSEFVTERRNSTQRSATDAETEDITEMLDILDNIGVLRNVKFAALQYSRLPKYDPEKLNICAVVDRQVWLLITLLLH